MQVSNTERNAFLESAYTSSPGEPFPIQEYNVTDHFCQGLLLLTCPLHFLPLIPGHLGSKKMILEEEEAVLQVNCKPFCTINTRRPYGELGSVDKTHCLCCVGVASNLSGTFPIFIGNGCEDEKVSEIVAELKLRMKARGDTGQISRTEETLKEIQELRTELSDLKADMKLVLKALNIPTSDDNLMERH